jgi:methyl-accepting chemotaxis protein
MAAYFDTTLEHLKHLVIVIQNEADALDSIGADLSSNMDATSQAMNDIGGVIQTIQKRATDQSASVITTSAAMSQISENISRLNEEVEAQSDSVAQASGAIEEMLTNIDSVTKIIRTNAENVSQLVESTGVGRSGLQHVAEDIQEIARESEGLLEINSVIQNVASLTNLLSMNAAIEAAHAGEAGKGFAVVAGEIRKLSVSSGEQSKTISHVLKRIRDSISKISMATNSVMERFEAINEGIKTVSEQEGRIRNAMEAQSSGSRQIQEAMQTLNGVTQTVRSGSEEMRKGSKKVIQEGANLESVTAEITEGMAGMASRAGSIDQAVKHVSDISRKNLRNIDTLREAIAHFVVLDKVITWDPSMAVGVKQIDEQHQQLFAALGRLVDTTTLEKGDAELKKALYFLANYVSTHFSDEEEIQKRYRYPDFHNHHRIHEAFKRGVARLVQKLEEQGASDALLAEVKHTCGDWLVTHIKGQDMKIGAHIRKVEARQK